MPQCTSLAEVVLSRASTGDAPANVAWKCSSWPDDVLGGLGLNDERECPDLRVRRLPRSYCRELQPGMPQRTSLGNAHRGRMMF
ncbi:hypothetical protein CDL15_Pgr020669 [Punica granatum]|uniref:Uncharacterized protein n=1 Tax=Punica granatum TaxID=22663 RepID=A0A218XMI0_PUNGR|nr:hypothetical protein CDL15_Pgr020669 [Punica granatum]